MVPEKLTFSALSRCQIEADFSGGHITSDAGLLLLREVDKQHRLTSVLSDPRTPEFPCTWVVGHREGIFNPLMFLARMFHKPPSRSQSLALSDYFSA